MELLDYLASLRSRAEHQIKSDAIYARKLALQLTAHGLTEIEPIGTPTVAKDWDSHIVIRAGTTQKRRNGWHLRQMGHLHIGKEQACFFGDDGTIQELPVRQIATTASILNCIVVVTLRRPRGKQIGLFLPTRTLEAVTHLDGVKSRVSDKGSSNTAPRRVRAAIEVANRGINAAKRLGNRTSDAKASDDG